MNSQEKCQNYVPYKFLDEMEADLFPFSLIDVVVLWVNAVNK